MKGFSIITLVILSLGLGRVQAQSQNLLSPIGNIGIQTLKPMYPLDVRGQARFSNHIIVDSSAIVNELISRGQVVLESFELDTIGAVNNLLGTVDGVVQGVPIETLSVLLDEVQTLDPCYKTNAAGEIVALRLPPKWESESEDLNAWLYTGANCATRVGIGTDRPKRYLDVRGDVYFERLLNLGDNPDLTSQEGRLRVETDGHNMGIKVVEVNSNAGTQRFYQAKMNNPEEKIAFSSLDIGNNYEPIKIMAKGQYYGHITGNNDAVFKGVYENHTGFEAFGNGTLEMHYKDLDSETDAAIVDIYNKADEPIFRIKENNITYAAEIIITRPVNFPDYVFAPNYQRLSLGELENFIKTERHLPGMPTAEQVNEEGLDLAKVQTLTVEKVEELYLYMLEMNERIAILEAENAKLKKQKGQ